MTNVIFPGLGGIHVSIDPEAFSVFGWSVKWYGVIIAVGFLLAILYALKKAPKIGLKQDDVMDVLIFAVPAGVICARLYYVFFQSNMYKDDPGSVLRIWEGGMAIYGGIIGSVAAGVLVCLYKRVKIGAILDIGALGFLIGQSVGRWGNFVNGEAFGTETTLPWRMVFGLPGLADTAVGVHPAFLYESLWNALGFLLLHLIFNRRKYRGEIFLMYVTWYGAGRAAIEGLRTDSLMIPGSMMRVSQWLAIASCIIALGLLFYNRVFVLRDDEDINDPLVVSPGRPKKVKDDDVTTVLLNTEENDAEDAEDAEDDTELDDLTGEDDAGNG